MRAVPAKAEGVTSNPKRVPRGRPDLAQLLSEVLGSEFVGLYAYGSLLDESFVRGSSDLDCIAVTEGPIDEATLGQLETRLDAAARGETDLTRVQVSFLVRDRVLKDDPSACLYQFGSLSRSGSDGNPIIWLDFLQRGATLHGPDPRSFVPEVTRDMLHEALIREVGYIRDEISLKPESEWRDQPSYRAYAVLTLCRILYTHSTGSVISKSGAAEWAGVTHPEWVGQLASVAEGARQEAWTAEIPVSALEQLIDYASDTLEGAPGSAGSS